MGSKRCFIFSLIAATTAIVPLSAAFAGFELIAPKPQARVETPAVTPPQDFPPTAEPMPIAPAPEVEEVTIMPAGAPAQMSRSYADQAQQPDVYIPRAVATTSSGSVELFIDPYPLQSGQAMAPATGSESAGMDRAMLKQSGHLTGVASSGNRISMVPANGTVKSISRYDGSVVEQPGASTPSRIDGWSSPSAPITPMMGGEVKPLPVSPYAASAEIESVPVYPEPIAVAEPVYPSAPVYPAAAPLVPRAPEQAPVEITAYSPEPAPVSATGNFSEAVGFGRDLPLALALSQVVPADYTFSFAADVNAGENVSWQGGKPWNEVLDEMLAAKGLRAAISGNQVVVQNAG